MKCLKDNNKEQHSTKGHNPIKLLFHMILCCGLPILIILAIPFIARINLPAAGFLGVIAPFICPIFMGGMIFMMFRNNKKSCCDKKKTEEQ